MLTYNRYPFVYGNNQNCYPGVDNTTDYSYNPNSIQPFFPLQDPPPVLSDNPPITRLTLFKELTGFPNYGNPSGNADILYTGTRGVWTFQIPAPLFLLGGREAQIAIRGVLDDHYNVAESRYTARIIINNIVVFNGRVPFIHGRPEGGIFNNWRELVLNITNLRRNNRVEIINTSTTNPDDWIAFDWMELRMATFG
jgi:hypothetical protein